MWRTPPEIFELASELYGPFDLDGAADQANHLLPLWFGPGSPLSEDALTVRWGGYVAPNPDIFRSADTRPTQIFVNPPFGRGWLRRFVTKAHTEALAGRATTTLLLPATTEVPWFFDYVWHQDNARAYPHVDLTFLRGRVRFLRPDGTRAGSPGIGSLLVRFRAAGA